jgi:16S rRNA (guanine527-N7)-methyltransferase
MLEPALETVLRQGLQQLGLEYSELKIQKLLRYVQLLEQWNKHFNLTSVRAPEQMLIRHLLDSLSVIDYIPEQRVLDMGTGAGLPGLVLAIINSDRQYVLLDSNGKKTRFITQVKIELALDNVEVAKSRVETYHPGIPFPAVTSRAFASLSDSLALLENLLSVGGHFYAMKGKCPDQEIKELSSNYVLETIQPLVVPQLNEERHLIVIKRLA